ncbi:MAG: DUF1292 domain-containing protein [Hespellia sp.]|nr:DUF1292 domain-containing protein [Hespellia sp.]
MDDKIVFETEEGQEEFYVLEQTRVSGINYILVADSEEDDAICLILKDTSKSEDTDSVYEIVEDDEELKAVSKVFEELLEDVDIEM